MRRPWAISRRLTPGRHLPAAPRTCVRHGGVRRVALALLLGCLALLATAPVAAATLGKVTGKVTSASSKAGIEHVEVRFWKTENSWNREFTGTGGDYSAELEPGEYKVEWVP
jgi:hypothetical protein